MKFAFVLFSLAAALTLTAAHAAPSQSVASLGLAQEPSPRQTAATSITLAEAPQAVAEQRLEQPARAEGTATIIEGPSSGAETILVMIAAGVLALLAVSRRRRQ